MNNLWKKSFAVLLAVLMLLSVVPFVAFGGEAETHEHQFADDPDIAPVPASCTQAGHGAGWTCTVPGCGYIMWEAGKETIPALDHNWVLKETIQAACGVEGKKIYECSRCHETEERDKTPALEHVWGEWKVVKEPKSCNEQGEKQRTCTLCGKLQAEHIPPADHQPEDVAPVEATCTAPGKTAGTKCKVCGTILSGCETVKALGHDWVKGETTEPTCEQEGKTAYTCARCGETKNDDIKPKLGHKVIVDKGTEPACEQDGLSDGQHCERCGQILVKQEVIPKTGHDWEIVAAIAPTCTEPGRTEGRKCKVCGFVASESEDVPARGHIYTTEVITPATCEANGLTKKYCTECSISETIVEPAKGHKLGDWVYSDNFSCDVGGERYQVCANCGQKFNVEPVAPQGHDWSAEWTIDTPATCTSRGFKSHHCTRCDKKNDITTIAKLPHSYLDNVTKATTKRDGLITGVCSVCGVERKPVTLTRVTTIKLAKDSYVYDGKAKKPTVVVKNADGKKLKKDVDYKLSYASGRKLVGTYVVKVTLIGNYSGSKKLKFTISLGTPKGLEAKANRTKQTIGLSWAAVKGAKKYVIYCATEKNGEYKKLATTKRDAYTVKTLKPGTYYFKIRALTTNNEGYNAYSAYSTALKVKLPKA